MELYHERRNSENADNEKSGMRPVDISNYAFVTLSGRLVEVKDPENKKDIRDSFVRMIKDRDLSENVMVALGHSSQDPIEKIISEERNLIWKLVDVEKVTGIKNGT